MDHTLFYSWQTDSPNSCNRNFIRSALEKAGAQLEKITLQDSPRLDSGTDGVPGSPEVAAILFQKIEASSIFVGDVTLTGVVKKSEGAGGTNERQYPNPNVSIEMGLAAGILGWERIICVMNEYFGDAEAQPFDVRNRRYPISYCLAPDADEATRLKVKDNLVNDLKNALVVAEQSHLLKVERAIARLDVASLKAILFYQGGAYFADHSEFAKEHPNAIIRLLDLELVRTAVDGKHYAYHWTYLGTKVIEKLRPQKAGMEMATHTTSAMMALDQACGHQW